MNFKPLLLFIFLSFSIFGYAQLNLVDGTNIYTIDFDASLSGVNQGAFTGTGLNNPPSSGQLNSNAWAVAGMSDGSTTFGQSNTAGDFARGSSNGGVSSGGLYAFNTGSGIAIGIQPTGSDWTPGSISLRIVNNRSTTLNDIDIDYTVLVRNDQSRSNTFNFAYSLNNINYTSVNAVALTSPANPDANPSWVADTKSLSLSNLSLSPGASLYLRWSGSDAGGSGSRDEFALDDITLTTSGSTPNCTEPTAQASNLAFGTITDNSIQGSFTTASADKYLVVQSTNSALGATPNDGSNYSAGSILGNGTVIQYSNTNNFTASGLSASTTYNYFVFSANDNCTGGPDYLNTNPLSASATTEAEQNGDYYSSINNQTCAALKTALHNLIKDHIAYSYGDLWNIYQTTDDRQNDAGNATIVWDMYSDNPNGSENEFTFVTDQCGTYSGEGDCYNREHTFPKSWWGGSTSVPQYTDIFTVIPADGSVNGTRNNNPYGVVLAGSETTITNNGSKLGPSALSIPGYTGNVFEPIDEYKGDLARGYFYMITRYEDGISGWENNTSESNAVLDGNTYPGMEPWLINMLIDWHNNDPVSQKEIDRNNDIFNYQLNRNPFIDHPEYVALIWQNCGSSDTQAPTAPTALTASNTTESSTDLSWSGSTDNIGVTGYNVYQDGIMVTSTGATVTGASISGLLASTSYDFYVTATDAAGNESSASNTISVTTQTPTDTQAPSAPTALSASNVTESSANLTWNSSTDNVGVTAYNVYQDGSFLAAVSTTSYNASGLTASTTYDFYVTASDAAGNESSTSNTISVTTQTPADTQAPSAPTALSASNVTETSADLTWNSSTDNVGVTAYNVYQDGSFLVTVSTTSYNASGLTASTTYDFYVTASDAAGNESNASNTLSVTTDTPVGGPTVLHEGYFETGWDGWQSGGNDASRYSGSRSPEGTFSIKLRDNSGINSSMTSEAFDLSTFTTVEIQFSFRSFSFENNENFFVQYYDGSSWNTIANYIRGSDFQNNIDYTQAITIDNSSYNFATNAQFRFQADASANNDHVYIDAVIITGDPAGGSNFAAPSNEAIIAKATPGSINLQAKAKTISVFPNPAVNQLSINLEAGQIIQSLEIYNNLGQRILLDKQAQSTERLNVAHLEPGIYYLRVLDTDGKVYSLSFVKS